MIINGDIKVWLNKMSNPEVNIELESNSELQNLYDLHINGKHDKRSYVELHHRAMLYKRNLLVNRKENETELTQVNHFISELSGYRTTLSMDDLDQRMNILSIIATLFGPATFIGGFFGMNIQIPYQTSTAYNPFFAICVFSVWASIVIGIYLFLGSNKRTIISTSIITAIAFTIMAMFLWVIDPIYDIGYQVGENTNSTM